MFTSVFPVDKIVIFNFRHSATHEFHTYRVSVDQYDQGIS